jgi:hypothetical protein
MIADYTRLINKKYADLVLQNKDKVKNFLVKNKWSKSDMHSSRWSITIGNNQKHHFGTAKNVNGGYDDTNGILVDTSMGRMIVGYFKEEKVGGVRDNLQLLIRPYIAIDIDTGFEVIE